jgi:hypothetical protein
LQSFLLWCSFLPSFLPFSCVIPLSLTC